MSELLRALFWGTGLRKALTSAAATITAISGAVVAVPPAWSAMGLPEIATRSWAVSEVYQPIKLAQNSVTKQVVDLQIDLATGKSDQLENTRLTLEIEKIKSTDEMVKAKIDAQIRKIDRDMNALVDQIKTLRDMQNTYARGIR